MTKTATLWPALPLSAWQDTKDTLHMYTQVVGKLRLALMPKSNHTWSSALYVTARGLTTGPMPAGQRTLELQFDFIDHELVFLACEGDTRRLKLGGSVKDFYQAVFEKLAELGIAVSIWPVPVEVPNPIRFDQDTTHATYDAAAVTNFWQVLYRVDNAFKKHRARFTGKVSPVHFFWGSFDLAVTRFSGEPAAPGPGMTGFMAEAYNAELISVGFWPGGDWPGVGFFDTPLLYSYTFPKPAALDQASVSPAGAAWNPQLGEFVLSYDVVRAAEDPTSVICEFAQSTYEAGAKLANWPIAKFEL